MYTYYSDGKGLKLWDSAGPFEGQAMQQLINTASLPFIHKWVAGMPDVHFGMGATIGSVVATKRAIIPAAVGVDIGCGMMAVRTNLTASDLPDSLHALRMDLEAAVPVGFNCHNDRDMPDEVDHAIRFEVDYNEFYRIQDKHPKITSKKHSLQIGTLGGGNHFIEVCLDENDDVWIMLHSGSRGIGNIIGTYFISKAKEEMQRWHIDLPDPNLAYLPEGSQYFDDYIQAMSWAQNYAFQNREVMMKIIFRILRKWFPTVQGMTEAINCHHNYASIENHFGENVWVTRKGAVRARKREMGIIPGSMGTGSFIVRGLGNADSFQSCSHGAGRVMSRKKARQLISVEQHKAAVQGIECRVDADVVDESPGAYKRIEDVMDAQKDLVEIKFTLRQVLNIKG